MPSSFTWLDYSEHDRRKMLDVIDLFRERGTRDELGIGSIRDAFAELLFPGTSTIQTRARYFLLVPWIYQDLERRRIPSPRIAERARQCEIALIAAVEQSDDTYGLIGKLAKARLQRLPSSVYWQGLSTLGIRLFPGSQDQYHRSLDTFYTRTGQSARKHDEESATGRPRPNWHPQLPQSPAGFPEVASLTLEPAEAAYLQERILTHAPDTLFAFLADRGRSAETVDLPWQHHQLGEFPAGIREELEHGQNFSEAIHGVTLLYNLLLSEKANSDELVQRYRDELDEWQQLMEAHRDAFARWPRPRFWEIVNRGNLRVPKLTRFFVDDWLNLAILQPANHDVAAVVQARSLVRQRELHLKRGLARLDNSRALEIWLGGDAAAGIGRLSYRWETAQAILNDIWAGLAGAVR